MILTAAVILIAGTLLFVLTVRAKDIPPPEPVSPTAHLEERKARIYEGLRDLQFEYRVGKLSDDDYQRTKLSLQKELAGVLQEIERLQAPVAPPAVSAPTAKSNPKKQAGNTVCPHCGATFPQPMKFCGQCGKAMSA